MELRHLRYFLAIAEHSHFRAAAEELLVSQPTLSQQMKDLEKELGCALFERAGRGVRLTDAGSLFADYARRAMNLLDEGQAAIEEIDEMLRGRLRIGVVQTVGAYLAPSVVAKFSKEYPGVEIRVEELSAGEIESKLTDGSLDLAISFEPTGRRELMFEKLFDEQMVSISTNKHALAARKRLRVSDLVDESLCLLSRDYCTRRMIDAAFIEAESTPTCELRRWRLLLVIGPIVFVLAALEGVLVHRNVLEYSAEWAGATITTIEVALTISIALILTMLFSCTLPTSNESVIDSSAQLGPILPTITNPDSSD